MSFTISKNVYSHRTLKIGFVLNGTKFYNSKYLVNELPTENRNSLRFILRLYQRFKVGRSLNFTLENTNYLNYRTDVSWLG